MARLIIARLNTRERNKVNKMYVCCNVYTHPTQKPKHFIYINKTTNLNTTFRMKQKGYKLTQQIILDPTQETLDK